MSSRLRTVSLKNIALCYPALDEAQRIGLAREAMVHYVRNGFDTGVAWFWSKRRFDALFDPPVGGHHFHAAREKGKGVVVLSPHFGSWEMLGLRITEEIDGAILYKPGDDPDLDALLIGRRERFGALLLPANRKGLKSLLGFLRQGKVVGVLPDQEPTEGEGRFAPFFGVPALTGVLVPRLVRRTGAPVVFAVCARRPRGRYVLHVIPGDDELYSDDLDVATAALNRGVEACIAIDPAQYLWGYKRFRARPEGEQRLY